jgi:hypothetical protein
MLRVSLVIAACCLGNAPAARAADELSVFPSVITFDGGSGQQRLVVTETRDKTFTDRTGEATYATSAPAVAVVSRTGVVAAVGDGEATITVTANGTRAPTRGKSQREGHRAHR